MMDDNRDFILQMRGISKSFSEVKALDNVDLDLKAGEVLALMGENGAGKSTLMKILTGIYTKDAGEVRLFGSPVEFNDIKAAQKAGISIIHQELNMMNHLTVAQNIFIGNEPMKHRFFIDDRKMIEDSKKVLARIGVDIDPSVKVGSLTVGKQQMIEIAKAISSDCRILVLDEPTAALTQLEVEELFNIMNDLKTKGIGMIYISHRMDEIMRISDRVAVMRDGEYIGTVNTEDTSKDEIVKMMVGRVIYGDKKEKSNVTPDAPVVMEVKNLNRSNVIKDVAFKLHKGEILGFAGLMGAGRTEVARAVYGADRFDTGEVYINGNKVNITSPRDAVKNGICYLSEDRKQFGLLLDKSVADNSVLSSISDYVHNGWIDDKEIRSDAIKQNKKLRTKTPTVDQQLKKLSGGNQQKVVLARWLLKDADIFIFDEPTRGIDVGAKSEMYELVDELAKQGKSIIVISSELAEVQRLCDRVLVMCEGRITADLDIQDADQETIMHYATMRN